MDDRLMECYLVVRCVFPEIQAYKAIFTARKAISLPKVSSYDTSEPPFTDPSLPTPEDDASRLAGMQEGTGI